MNRFSAEAQKREKDLDEKMAGILFMHPALSMLLFGIAAPIMILAAVTLSTCAIVLPLALIFGWL